MFENQRELSQRVPNSALFNVPRFQTPPVSAHGLVALCALGCIFSDLTLIQATLMEIDKILGMIYATPLYLSLSTPPLSPTSFLTLMIMA